MKNFFLSVPDTLRKHDEYLLLYFIVVRYPLVNSGKKKYNILEILLRAPLFLLYRIVKIMFIKIPIRV